MSTNALYYGDNLDILRRHIKDESIDLVYLDPPFNSNASYNVVFSAKEGTQSAAQIQAFDTWQWDETAAWLFAQTVEQGGAVADVLLALERFIPASDMLAYLAMMAPRLIELRRVLKPSGSLYPHCDPTASHYLKLVLDGIFAPLTSETRSSGSGHTPTVTSSKAPDISVASPIPFSSTLDLTTRPGQHSIARTMRRMWRETIVGSTIMGGVTASTTFKALGGPRRETRTTR